MTLVFARATGEREGGEGGEGGRERGGGGGVPGRGINSRTLVQGMGDLSGHQRKRKCSFPKAFGCMRMRILLSHNHAFILVHLHFPFLARTITCTTCAAVTPTAQHLCVLDFPPVCKQSHSLRLHWQILVRGIVASPSVYFFVACICSLKTSMLSFSCVSTELISSRTAAPVQSSPRPDLRGYAPSRPPA